MTISNFYLFCSENSVNPKLNKHNFYENFYLTNFDKKYFESFKESMTIILKNDYNIIVNEFVFGQAHCTEKPNLTVTGSIPNLIQFLIDFYNMTINDIYLEFPQLFNKEA